MFHGETSLCVCHVFLNTQGEHIGGALSANPRRWPPRRDSTSALTTRGFRGALAGAQTFRNGWPIFSGTLTPKQIGGVGATGVRRGAMGSGSQCR